MGSLLQLIFNLFASSSPKPAPAPEKKPEPVAEPQPVQPVPQPVPQPVEAPMNETKAVDWNDPKCKISKHFTVKEVTYLNSWNVYHIPTDEQKKAILDLAPKLEKAIDLLEARYGAKGVSVHCWMRPDKAICPGSKWDGMDYNRYIYETQVWKDLTAAEKAEKKVPQSPHRTGHAIDFHMIGMEGADNCAKVRGTLIPSLEAFGLRMEDISGGWVHLDDLPVKNSRFFKP